MLKDMFRTIAMGCLFGELYNLYACNDHHLNLKLFNDDNFRFK